MRKDSLVSSSIHRKKVTGCAEISTFGADNLSKLSLIQNLFVQCAVLWSGWAELAPSRREKSDWRFARRCADFHLRHYSC